jgi:hypothetical protein
MVKMKENTGGGPFWWNSKMEIIPSNYRRTSELILRIHNKE